MEGGWFLEEEWFDDIHFFFEGNVWLNYTTHEPLSICPASPAKGHEWCLRRAQMFPAHAWFLWSDRQSLKLLLCRCVCEGELPVRMPVWLPAKCHAKNEKWNVLSAVNLEKFEASHTYWILLFIKCLMQHVPLFWEGMLLIEVFGWRLWLFTCFLGSVKSLFLFIRGMACKGSTLAQIYLELWSK